MALAGAARRRSRPTAPRAAWRGLRRRRAGEVGRRCSLVVGVYFWLVFGLLSRRFERQADVFGCRAVSCGRPDCPPHADYDGPPTSPGRSTARSARSASGSSSTRWRTCRCERDRARPPGRGGTAASPAGSRSWRACKASPEAERRFQSGVVWLRLVRPYARGGASWLAFASGAFESLPRRIGVRAAARHPHEAGREARAVKAAEAERPTIRKASAIAAPAGRCARTRRGSSPGPGRGRSPAHMGFEQEQALERPARRHRIGDRAGLPDSSAAAPAAPHRRARARHDRPKARPRRPRAGATAPGSRGPPPAPPPRPARAARSPPARDPSAPRGPRRSPSTGRTGRGRGEQGRLIGRAAPGPSPRGAASRRAHPRGPRPRARTRRPRARATRAATPATSRPARTRARSAGPG